MLSQMLETYLSHNHIPYRWIPVKRHFTALQKAISAHVARNRFAKTVIVRADDKYVICAIPADEKVVLSLLKDTLGASDISLVDEQEFKEQFPDCETGAMPPFGKLFGMSVYVSHSLAEKKQITCNGGSHSDTISISYQDFDRLEHPHVGYFSL